MRHYETFKKVKNLLAVIPYTINFSVSTSYSTDIKYKKNKCFLVSRLNDIFRDEFLNALKQKEPVFSDSTYKVQSDGGFKLELQSIDESLTSTFTFTVSYRV
jgi:hypothetical protein